MNELEDTRKRKFQRVPRNNSYVALRVNGSTSAGCCSSWWGRQPPIIQNTDSKYMNTTDYNDTNCEQ